MNVVLSILLGNPRRQKRELAKPGALLGRTCDRVSLRATDHGDAVPDGA